MRVQTREPPLPTWRGLSRVYPSLMLHDPVARARLVLIGWWMAWPLFHLGAWALPPWFFEQVVVGLSVYAVVATKQDDYHTCQAKVAAEATGLSDDAG